MKKLLVCMAVVFAFAITSAAQDTNPQSSNAGTSSQTSTKSSKSGKKGMSSTSGSKTTTGCIEKSGDSYMLKNGRYKSGVKVSGSDDLGPHVGHTVKLTGSWTTPGQEFAETKVDMVSDSCKMGGGKAMSSTGSKNKKKSSSGAATGSTPPQSL